VSRLLEKGVAYQGEDGSVYFAIERFPSYGRLSRIEQREIKVGARVSSDEYAKEDARDFVLWKAAKPEDEAVGAAWDAPFGRGRPGWHLECSAMAQHFLGETIDIHAGGVDLIFPHHEDEIAQSEAATGRPFARFWLHGEFLLVGGTKMSKRYGNFLTARDLREQGWDPAAVRYLFGQTHYRRQLNFTDEALSGALGGAQRLREFRDRFGKTPAGANPALQGSAAQLDTAFRTAMDEDLDVPAALGAVMTFVRSANAELDRGSPADPAALATFDHVTDVLQVVPAGSLGVPAPSMEGKGTVAAPGVAPAVGSEAWAADLAGQRAQAKKEKDWARADRFRKLLLDNGFEVRDTKDGGFELRRVAAPPA